MCPASRAWRRRGGLGAEGPGVPAASVNSSPGTQAEQRREMRAVIPGAGLRCVKLPFLRSRKKTDGLCDPPR